MLMAALLAFASPACTDTIKETYDIDITGAADAFAGATKVTLYASGTEVASAAINGNAPFSLAWRDVDPLERANAVFSIKATDAANAVVAAGASPDIELLPSSAKIRIFVQRPGSLARATDLERSLAGHVSVSAEALTSQGLRLAMTAPVFGSGKQLTPAAAEVFSNDLYVYNPVTHVTQRLGSMQGVARADAAGLARTDGTVMVFGGRGSNPETAAQTSARLDMIRIGRRAVNTFEIAIDTGVTGPVEAGRAKGVMVQIGRPVFVFGGVDVNDTPLDTVVNIDPDGRPTSPIEVATRAVGMTREPTRMMAARVGHTASAVTTLGMAATATTPTVPPQTLVLVFGGAAPGAPVADLFNPADQTFVPLPDLVPAGGGRKLHAAVNVTVAEQNRLLLLGGQGDDGAPRGDSVLYDPITKAFSAGALTLRTPRHSFSAFVVANDLVVAGGIGADGKRLATAEVYDAKTFAFVTELKAEARSGATVTPLPNLTMMLLGGTTETSFSAAIEIYQPRS
jgi:hypothetical protein